MKRKWIHLGFFLSLVILLALGQLQRISFGPFTALYLHDLVISSWTAMILFTNWHKVQDQLKLLLANLVTNSTLLITLLIMLVGWGGAVITQTFPLWTLLFIARLTVYLIWARCIYLTKIISKEWWQLGFLSSGLLIAFFGLLQYLLVPDTRFLSILGWDDHYFRLISTQLDPNFTGLLLSVTLFWWWETPFSWWQWLVHGLSSKQLKNLQQATTFVISILLLIAIGLTFSRSSWVSLIIGSLFLLKPKINWKIGLAGLALLALTITLAPKPTGEGVQILRTSSISARATNSLYWLSSMQQYQLLVGRGLFVPSPNEFSVSKGVEADHANLPDNLVILLISGLGIMGSIAVVLLAIQWLKKHSLNTATSAVLATVLIHSLFNNSLLQVFILLFVLGTLIRQQKLEAVTA